MRAGKASSACDCGTRQAASCAASGAPARSTRETSERSRRQAAAPIAMKSLSVLAPAARAAARASAANTPAAAACERSRICAPIATPPRKSSVDPGRRNTPCGRFWIGKSQPAACAESTQLRRAGSWVGFSMETPQTKVWAGQVPAQQVIRSGAGCRRRRSSRSPRRCAAARESSTSRSCRS